MFRLMLAVGIALVAVDLGAEVKPNREAMKIIEGEWTIEGAEATFRETCEWFHLRSHMVCNSESRRKDGSVKRGVSVFSFSDEKGRFVYYHYGSSGIVVVHDVFFDGPTLLATGERRDGNDLIRNQVKMSPRSDGSYDFVEQESTNGGPWIESARVHYIRRAAAAAQ